ncbi:hypothetical protein [Sphingomonas sp. Leaf37]|uniref:hypothetical protein n=1 Tax=Sphingomonas sp. Leaf37 TaxID=2876552 RepID=UPI001E286443|nr:hypothetical protein [Sphingomonas sp. Leaf37]
MAEKSRNPDAALVKQTRSMDRPRKALGLRIGGGILAAILSYAGVTFSLAQYLVTRDASTAHTFAPYDGQITAGLAGSLMKADMTASERVRPRRLALLALKQDPTALGAATVLGVIAQFDGDIKTARRWFSYSEKLSRRDVVTQMWAIEDAVQRGDVQEAVNHYDIMLRVKPGMAAMLFPILGKSSSEPAIRTALVKKLRQRPRWGENFINFMSVGGIDPSITVLLFRELALNHIPVPQVTQARTIDALASAGQFDRAWDYYALNHPGVARQRVRDGNFDNVTNSPSLFDWSLINDGKINTSIQEDSGRNVFGYTASGSIESVMLRQSEMLPAGRYVFKSRGKYSNSGTANVYWSVACLDGKQIARIEGQQESAGFVFSDAFDVPKDCPIQVLSLVARPTDRITGFSGQIQEVELAPAR